MNMNNDVLTLIRQACSKGTQKDVAAEIGISDPYLSDILAGRRAISESVANHFGYTRKTILVPIDAIIEVRYTLPGGNGNHTPAVIAVGLAQPCQDAELVEA
jgi:hypothetical protein